jgi:hypothetical protein
VSSKKRTIAGEDAQLIPFNSDREWLFFWLDTWITMSPRLDAMRDIGRPVGRIIGVVNLHFQCYDAETTPVMLSHHL